MNDYSKEWDMILYLSNGSKIRPIITQRLQLFADVVLVLYDSKNKELIPPSPFFIWVDFNGVCVLWKLFEERAESFIISCMQLVLDESFSEGYNQTREKFYEFYERSQLVI